jgi:hypothetical protein
MSKRTLVASLVGIVTIGGITAGGLAVADASASTDPSLANTSARYTDTGTLTFTTDVSDDSGVRSLKVLAWPAGSKLDPTEAELRSAESATCRSTAAETSRCTYTVRATKEEASELTTGTWYVSALATGEDGDTTFAPQAAAFEVTR